MLYEKGYLCLPLRKHVEFMPNATLVKCSKCGQECWDRVDNKTIEELNKLYGCIEKVCTKCALKAGIMS